jgi:hypothetical protein
MEHVSIMQSAPGQVSRLSQSQVASIVTKSRYRLLPRVCNVLPKDVMNHSRFGYTVCALCSEMRNSLSLMSMKRIRGS